MNIDEMSTDELKKALVAKDELVKELEQTLADMKDEAESSIVSKNEESSNEDEDETTLTEDDEDEDEKKKASMSETTSLGESMLLSEINSLRENNARLNERLETIEAEKREIECNDAVKTLLSEGRISPAEASVAAKAWAVKAVQPEFWSMFNERPLNSTVPLNQIGHGASGQEISKTSLNERVQALSIEKGVSYSEALTQFRNENPDYYAKAYGV